MNDWRFPNDEDYEWLAGIDWGKCNICGGLGFINTGERILPCPEMACEAGQAKREELAQRMISIANIPHQYAHATLDAIHRLPNEEQNGKRMAYKFADVFARDLQVFPASIIGDKWSGGDEPRNWLMFFGAVGTGKTYLACAILNAINRRGKPARYVRLDDFLQEIMTSYKDSTGETTAQILNRYQDFPVLLIDEANLSRVSEHSQQMMESLLRYRYMHDKATIFTANTDQADFETMWGKRISSVVMDKAAWLHVGGFALRNTSNEIRDDE